ncbi:hypothetical protein [Antarctobacter heliothermus]|uniref:Uncharacterized protein n=1 Tax=Antarctobacter heliothermus TaxID=74033 RepID=A0A239II48_9RHOB|nr:hypothetical protein [Antarctobacter heliothermus]SNS93199.1 hypothetical protein SAMN04488078_10438 [Antarctobacter heliothermus]
MTADGLPAELGTILSRAAALGTGPRRIIPATSEEALGAVLDAVAACILPRILTISDETGLLLALEAAAGNLIQLVDASDALRTGSADLMSRPLRPADLGPVAAFLSRAFPGEQVITFSTSAPQSAPDPAHAGLTCPAILHCLGLTPFDLAVPDRLACLIEAADEVLIAICRPGQAPLAIQPGQTLADDVRAFADCVFDGLGDHNNILQENEILFFTPKANPDLALGLILSQAGPVALIFVADCLPEIAAYWANMANTPLFCDPA